MMHKYSNYANKNEETSYITRTFDIKHANTIIQRVIFTYSK